MLRMLLIKGRRESGLTASFSDVDPHRIGYVWWTHREIDATGSNIADPRAGQDQRNPLLLHSSPRPLTKEGRSPYETHHTVVEHHDLNPTDGKRGGAGCDHYLYQP